MQAICGDRPLIAALEFDNCIRGNLGSVLRGQRYFYRYVAKGAGKGTAIVELRHMPVIGWVVEEALGPDNDDLPAHHRMAIITLFKKAGIIAAPPLRSPDTGWFEII